MSLFSFGFVSNAFTPFQIEVRNNATGEVIFKDNMTGAVAGIVRADYR